MDRWNNYLSHHGIEGQKWGQRRFQNEDGTYTEAGKQRYNTDYDAASQSSGSKQRKAIKGLSDTDLADRIKRLEQEKRYKNLMDEVDHPGRKKAKEVVDRVISSPAQEFGAALTRSALQTAFNFGMGRLSRKVGLSKDTFGGAMLDGVRVKYKK